MASIKIKLGNLELESEGAEEFLKSEVPKFLKLAVETYSQFPAVAAVSAKKFKKPQTDTEKVARVLDVLAKEREEITLAEIAEACEKDGVEKAKIFPILAEFQAQGDKKAFRRLGEFESNLLLDLDNQENNSYGNLVTELKKFSNHR
jgi:hypothetical protein